jgi:hypothetical protein
MIARAYILLPFTLSIRQNEGLEPYDFDKDACRVRVYPPCQCDLTPTEVATTSPTPMGDIIRRLQPAAQQTATETVVINGTPTVQANLLHIDFIKADFDRRPTGRATDYALGDPSLKSVFSLANDVLARLRAITRGTELQSLAPDECFWRLDYLTDAGHILPRSAGPMRRRFGRPLRWRVAVVTKEVWQQAEALPADFTAHAWDTLLLDAESLLPDVDAAIALANAALETFSKWLAGQLAATAGLPSGLWDWINKRGDWYKEPSVDDRVDPLLKVFTGHSLKDESELWEAYRHLRSARNSFSHSGRPVLRRGNAEHEVTADVAAVLVKRAQQIVDWCEARLPSAVRRPKLTTQLEFLFWTNTLGLPTLPEGDEEQPGPGELGQTPAAP